MYDFTWLDRQIRECAAMSIKPWICISYGNPVWGSDFRLGMRVKQVTDNPEAFEAWLRYTRALVARYRDAVDEWEVWNEPFGQADEYAEMFYRTAKAIRELQPEAKVYCTAIAMHTDMAKSDYAVVLEKLKRENALDLASRFIYHPYDPNPDATYEAGKGQFVWQMALPLRRFVKGYSPSFDIMQGETGCPAQLEFAHALNGIEWTEYSQSKWNLRRAIGDASRGIPSSVFTMIDLQYTFMLQSFGLVRSNTLKEFVYRRPSWYAMRNVYSLFDDDTHPLELVVGQPAEIVRRSDPRDAAKRELTRASFTRLGRPQHFFWYSNERPSNRLELDRVVIRVPGRIAEPVWVDMITGRVCEIPLESVRAEGGETVLFDVPMWDSPVLVADRAAVSVRDELAGHRPQTWFHLIGGNVSKEGLTTDLEAIASAGIGGVQFFHGQMGQAYPWPRTKGQIPCLSERWDEVVAHAADECARLGLKFEMQNCPGWSMSGGPWITPDKAMRRLVAFRPGEKPSFDADDDFREIGSVTFPAPAGWDDPDPVPTSVVTNGDERIFFFGSPVTVRSVELPSPASLNNEWCYEKWLVVEVSVPDGADGWKPVLRRDYPRGCWQDDVPVTFSFAAATSDRWRVVFSHRRPVKKVEFVRFHPVARLDGWEALAGWTFRDLPARGEGMPCKATDKKATLVFGHVNMKVRNGPAPEEARGWECDKLDPKGFAANFDGYLGRLMKGALAGGKLKGMVVDSWECLRQSWTERMETYFERMNGYSPRPHLPALFGYAVGDAEKTGRFLIDWRRTVSRLVEENYYRAFAELGRANGLTVQFETAFQDVIPGDPLRYWKYADIPMCEFWQPFDNEKGFVGSDNFKPVRPCVSAAHLYGKRRVQAEALTAMSLDWDEDFNRFKKVVDRHFARGVTHLVYHTYTHNPQVGEDFLPPGTSFGWSIGSPFLRGQTWWRFMPLFSEYVARCGRELERGLPVVDVLWYLGDDNPYRPDENAPFPKGYKYDYITQDALLERVSAKDGRFMLPDGMRYRLLWIPDGTFLLPETERKLAELERAGGRICRGELKIDWESPLAAGTGLDPESGIEWCQRHDGDEDIFFIAERDGSSRFLRRDERSGEVRVYDPMTGVVRPFSGKAAPTAAVPVEMRPEAEYPAWATEREYVGRVTMEGDGPCGATLDLGKVASWAEVFVNGRTVGTLWAEPYACDISKFLMRGENEIRVCVTSTWHNRLVHDASLPVQERKTWTIGGPSADAPFRPSGLLGPVVLRREE